MLDGFSISRDGAADLGDRSVYEHFSESRDDEASGRSSKIFQFTAKTPPTWVIGGPCERFVFFFPTSRDNAIDEAVGPMLETFSNSHGNGSTVPSIARKFFPYPASTPCTGRSVYARELSNVPRERVDRSTLENIPKPRDNATGVTSGPCPKILQALATTSRSGPRSESRFKVQRQPCGPSVGPVPENFSKPRGNMMIGPCSKTSQFPHGNAIDDVIGRCSKISQVPREPH